MKEQIDWYQRYIVAKSEADEHLNRAVEASHRIQSMTYETEKTAELLAAIKERDNEYADYRRYSRDAGKAHGIYLRQCQARERAVCNRLAGRGR